ncbi:hypothetical protein SVIOM74S_02740 [Streptomyces violarus]
MVNAGRLTCVSRETSGVCPRSVQPATTGQNLVRLRGKRWTSGAPVGQPDLRADSFPCLSAHPPSDAPRSRRLRRLVRGPGVATGGAQVGLPPHGRKGLRHRRPGRRPRERLCRHRVRTTGAPRLRGDRHGPRRRTARPTGRGTPADAPRHLSDGHHTPHPACHAVRPTPLRGTRLQGHRAGGDGAGVSLLADRSRRSPPVPRPPRISLRSSGSTKAFGTDRTHRHPAAGLRRPVARGGGGGRIIAAAWPNMDTHVVGPLIARDTSVAQALIASLAAHTDRPLAPTSTSGTPSCSRG